MTEKNKEGHLIKKFYLVYTTLSLGYETASRLRAAALRGLRLWVAPGLYRNRQRPAGRHHAAGCPAAPGYNARYHSYAAAPAPPPSADGLAGGCQQAGAGVLRHRPPAATSAQPEATSAFGPDRSAGGRVSYGNCLVNIPLGHSVGVLESPSLLRLEFHNDPGKHLFVTHIQLTNAGNFFR